jgi:hypothetical protein
VTSELEPDTAEWLERPIVAGDEAKVKGLVLRKKTGETLALLLDAPYPRLATPEARPIDGDRARALVHEVLQAYATDLSAETDDAKLGLQPPALTAEVVFGDGSPPARLLLGDAAPPSSHSNPSYYARVPEKPGPLLVPQMAVAQIVSATSESVALLHAFGEKQPGALARATFRDGERTITLEKDPRGAWTVSAVGSGVTVAPRRLEQADEPKRARALNAALGLKVEGFDRTNNDTHGLLAPQTALLIETANHERIELSFGSVDGMTVWGRRADLPFPLGLPADGLAELRSAFAALLN